MPLRRWLAALAAPLLAGNAPAHIPASADPLVITGVTSALGGMGFSNEAGDWRFVTHLIVWRQGDGPAITQELRLEMPVASEAALQQMMDQLPSGEVIRLRLAEAPRPNGARQFAAMRALIGPTSDTELAALAEPILRPPPFDHPQLGRFTPLERLPALFEGQIDWRGQPVQMMLEAATPADRESSAAAAVRLIADQPGWQAKAEARILAELYETWDENWRNDAPRLTKAEWLARLTLESIAIAPDGSVTFDFADGDLFWGHIVTASGTITDGFTDATIAG